MFLRLDFSGPSGGWGIESPTLGLLSNDLPFEKLGPAESPLPYFERLDIYIYIDCVRC